MNWLFIGFHYDIGIQLKVTKLFFTKMQFMKNDVASMHFDS